MIKRYKTVISGIRKDLSPQSYLKVPQSDVFQGIKILSGNGFKFLTYMFSRQTDTIFDPDEICRKLGITRRTLGAIHKELQEKDFMYVEHNKTHDLYVLGQKAVHEFKKKHGIEA